MRLKAEVLSITGVLPGILSAASQWKTTNFEAGSSCATLTSFKGMRA